LGEGDETPEGNNAISEVCVSLFTGGDCDEANYFDLPLDRLISQLNGPRLKSIAFKSGSVNQSILKTTSVDWWPLEDDGAAHEKRIEFACVRNNES